jgi:hypothetical protein
MIELDPLLGPAEGRNSNPRSPLDGFPSSHSDVFLVSCWLGARQQGAKTGEASTPCQNESIYAACVLSTLLNWDLARSIANAGRQTCPKSGIGSVPSTRIRGRYGLSRKNQLS